MKRTIALAALIGLFVSCGLGEAENPNALQEVTEYTFDEVGWTVEIPAGWEIVTEEEQQELDERGHDYIEDATTLDIDYSQLLNLINIKKNETNSFIATAEPFPIEFRGEYEFTNDYLKDIMLVTYQNQGMQTEAGPTETVKIDGLDFVTYSFKIYKEGEMILQQSMYSKWINGYDFAVAMTYADDQHRDEMLDILKSSSFFQAEEPNWEAEEAQEYYLTIIDTAMMLYEVGNYEASKVYFQKGAELKPDYQYPTNMIIECDAMIEEVSSPLLD